MGNQQYFELPEFSAILTFVDAIFAEINMGLLIYHVEDVEDIRTARLIYANRQASEFTGTDLGRQIGKLIFDAFPFLKGTEVERLYQEVAAEKGKPILVSAKVPRSYDLPIGQLRYGNPNVLAVRVHDAGGKGGMLGLPHVRIIRTPAR